MLAFLLTIALAQDAIPDEVGRLLQTVARFQPREIPKSGTPIQVGTRTGMRLVIKERIDTGGQQGAAPPGTKPEPPPPAEYNHSQLIVVAGDKPLSEAEAASLPWDDLRQDEKVSTKFLGIGKGHSFYAKMPPHEMILYVQLGGLGGGSDPLELAFESLDIASEANSWHAKKFLAAFGNKSQRRLFEWVESGRDRWERALATIGMMEGDGSTAFLVRFYATADKQKQASVWSALSLGPLRKEAKPIYMDMLMAGQFITRAGKAAVAFEWPEFAPLLEDSLKYMRGGFDEYTVAFIQARSLRGLTVPEKVVKAMDSMRTSWDATPRQLLEAKRALTSYADPDPIAVAAFGALRILTKAPEAENAFAKDVLLALPRFSTRAYLERVIRECPDKAAVERARKLLAEIR